MFDALIHLHFHLLFLYYILLNLLYIFYLFNRFTLSNAINLRLNLILQIFGDSKSG